MSWSDVPEAYDQSFNKKVKHRVYQAGDLVIKCTILPQGDPREKWTPTYEGPFVIKNIFSGEAISLNSVHGDHFPPVVNMNRANT